MIVALTQPTLDSMSSYLSKSLPHEDKSYQLPVANQIVNNITANQSVAILVNKLGEGETLLSAQFGLNPDWAKQPVSYANLTAPLETVTGIKTYRKPYRKSQFCVVPLLGFYVQDSKTENIMLVKKQDGTVFLAPALYEYNLHFDVPIHSVALLTNMPSDAHLFSSHAVQSPSPLLVDNDQLSLFLVANWKFNKGYYHQLTDDFVIEHNKENPLVT